MRRVAERPARLTAFWGRRLAFSLALFSLAACAAEPPPPHLVPPLTETVEATRPGQYTYAIPDVGQAPFAQGQACEKNLKMAQERAGQVADYNLRSLLGQRRIRVEHLLMSREDKPDGTVCVAVRATGYPD